MKKISLLTVMLIFAFSAIVFAQTIPADKATINLKEAWKVEGKQKPVIFKHQDHADKMSCDKCHSTPNGGDKKTFTAEIKGNTDKNPAHKWCWDCHKAQPKDPVKKSCNKCHSGK